MKSNTENEIEVLRIAYAAELPLKSGELQNALKLALKTLAQGKAPAWQDVEYFAHKLGGSSGTYGFTHLAVTCAHLEDIISDGSLAALAMASPKLATEHLAKWLGIFIVQARLAHLRKPPATVPKELIAPLKQQLASLSERKAA